MIEIYKFALSSLWNFCCSMVIFYLVLYYGVNACLRIIGRIVRMITITFRGWPPAHLDADGDFQEEMEVIEKKQ